MLDNVQQVTNTMLNSAQKDVERMQHAVDKERDANRALMDRLIPAPRPQSFPSIPRPIDFEQCDPFGPYCGPIHIGSPP
jgi:hypothetical protein